MKLLNKFNQAGDTIVEVMVATSILAMVLAVSFVSANRSLSVGTDAANRKQALQYAQAQVELLKVYLDQNPGATINSNQAFCVDLDPATGNTTYHIDYQPSNCDQNNGQFHTEIQYQFDYLSNSPTTNKSYSIECIWQATASHNLDKVVLYYRYL